MLDSPTASIYASGSANVTVDARAVAEGLAGGNAAPGSSERGPGELAGLAV